MTDATLGDATLDALAQRLLAAARDRVPIAPLTEEHPAIGLGQIRHRAGFDVPAATSTPKLARLHPVTTSTTTTAVVNPTLSTVCPVPGALTRSTL